MRKEPRVICGEVAHLKKKTDKNKADLAMLQNQFLDPCEKRRNFRRDFIHR